MSTPENENIVKTALEAGRMLATEPDAIVGTPFLVIPKDHELRLFNDLRDNPVRADQLTKHTTAQSFIDYYNKFSDSDSVIFINEEDTLFTAIFDYHSTEKSGWKAHRARFSMQPTQDFNAWLANDKKPLSQSDFGRFIEDHLPNIQEPPAADMLEIALSIQAKSEVKFSKATRLQNGQTQFAYHEVIDGQAGSKGELKIPDTFSIGLSLYRGSPAYKIEARLRYRIKEGNLQMWYELVRLHDVIDANVKDVTQQIIDGIADNKQIYIGTAG